MRDRAVTAGTRVPALFCVLYVAAAIVLAVLGFWLLALVIAALAIVFGVAIVRDAFARARRTLDDAEQLVAAPRDVPRIGEDHRTS